MSWEAVLGVDWATVWVATEVKGEICLSEIVLRPSKALKVKDGKLLAGKGDMGTFLGFGTSAEALVGILPISGRDVVLIRAAGGNHPQEDQIQKKLRETRSLLEELAREHGLDLP